MFTFCVQLKHENTQFFVQYALPEIKLETRQKLILTHPNFSSVIYKLYWIKTFSQTGRWKNSITK